jgi:hypothetical protein
MDEIPTDIGSRLRQAKEDRQPWIPRHVERLGNAARNAPGVS